MIRVINKKQQRIAWFLLTVMCIDLVSPYTAKAAASQTGSASGPVAAAANGMVDPFTGNFSYSVPLMVVPGPNGESVDITAGYHGGIRAEEQATWLGLGWGYEAGEISRSIAGVGDDITGKAQITAKSDYFVGSGYDQNYCYGPLYFKNMGSTGANAYDANLTPAQQQKSQDLSVQYKRLTATSGVNGYITLPFKFPNYDSYSVSGPGMGGSIKPYLRGGALSTLAKDTIFPAVFPGGNTTGIPIEFYFQGSTAVANFDNSTNRINSGTYVKYFTNNQINDVNNLFSNATHTGFLDYRTPAGTRPSTSFDGNGIGGFQVTNASGVTYHYALPVYNNDEIALDFSYTNLLSPNLPLGDPNNPWNVSRKPFKQATAWKLTAVTGPDYVDDGNHVVDANDKGYWVSYHYTLWSDNYNWSSSYYNFKTNMVYNGAPKFTGYTFDPLGRIYKSKGSIVRGNSQLYFLDYIKTATHTAFFVKDLRLDGHGYEKVLNPAAKPVPQLKLSKIILLKNEDAGLFSNSGTIPTDSRFNTSACNPNNDPDFVHIGKYNNQASAINTKSLKTIEFNTDYSLCKKLYNNINNTFGTTRCNFNYTNTAFNAANNSSYFVQEIFNPATGSFSTSDAANSGKLSLKEIISYESGKTKIYPSYLFSYNKNPDYNPLSVDAWGYYKSDFNINYPGNTTTTASKDNVDAWSLNQVTTPLGGTITVNYQSDEYVNEKDPDTKPSFIFPISSMSLSNPGNQVDFTSADFTSVFTDPVNVRASAKLTVPVKARCATDADDLQRFDHYQGSLTGSTTGGVGTSYSFQFANGGCPIVDDDIQWGCAGNAVSITTLYSPLSYGYAYVQVFLNKAYGGGTRVGSIAISDPESGQAYTQEYTYTGGLCSVVPAKFNVEGYDLTDNQDLYEPDGPFPNVGYSTISVKTISNNAQNNGRTEYSFSNNPAIYYSLTGFESVNLGSYDGFYNANGGPTTFTYTYFYGAITKNYGSTESYGKPARVNTYDASDVLIAYKRYKYEVTNYIPEGYSTYQGDQKINAKKPVKAYSSHGLDANGNSIGTSPVIKWADHYFLIDVFRTKGTCFLKETENFADGIVSTSKVNSRDPLTGNPTETMVIDPTAGAALTQTQYAYTQAPYASAFGPKSGCSSCSGSLNNLNAISQSISIRYPIFRDGNGALQINTGSSAGNLSGGSKTVYSNQVPVRKYNPSTAKYETTNLSSYLWFPMEAYQLLSDASTPGNTNPASYNWRKLSSAKTFSENYTALENEGVNSRRSGLKIGYNNLYPLSSVADATYTSFAFSSYEDKIDVDPSAATVYHFGGEVTGGSFQQIGTTAVPAHSGDYVAKVPAGTFGPGYFATGISVGRTYRASVWVHKNSPDNALLSCSLDGTVNGTPQYTYKSTAKNDPANITVGDWILMRVDIDVPSTYIASGGTQNDLRFYLYNTGSSDAWYDDFKVNPIDAPVGGAVYDPQTGLLKASIDADGFFTRYEYDAAGRVTRTWAETDKGVKKVSETTYHFARP